MLDAIRGPVESVIDGDTFEMRVAYYNRNNKYNKFQYGAYERIRLADSNAPELNTKAGRIAKERLKLKLGRKEVRCYIQARDTYGRLIATIEVL